MVRPAAVAHVAYLHLHVFVDLGPTLALFSVHGFLLVRWLLFLRINVLLLFWLGLARINYNCVDVDVNWWLLLILCITLIARLVAVRNSRSALFELFAPFLLLLLGIFPLLASQTLKFVLCLLRLLGLLLLLWLLFLNPSACDLHVKLLEVVELLVHFRGCQLATVRNLCDFILSEVNDDVFWLEVSVDYLAHPVKVVKPDEALPS